jgi:hypothetical protein
MDDGPEQSISSMLDAISDGGLIFNYLLIAEVMTEDGVDLRIAASGNITPWWALGALEFAKKVVMEDDTTEDDL